MLWYEINKFAFAFQLYFFRHIKTGRNYNNPYTKEPPNWEALLYMGLLTIKHNYKSYFLFVTSRSTLPFTMPAFTETLAVVFV